MTTRKSRDRKFIAVLIVATIVELVLLLAHSGVIRLGMAADSKEGQRAGVVAQTQNHLRRRSLNSLVWENSARDEVVNFYDSILTLKESTATLKLDNETEVELSENTLITIDPPDEVHNGEIRLRFVRGNLAARNPFAESQIGGEEWSVALKKGSEVELREVGDKGVEVQLKSGDAVIKAQGAQRDLKAHEILRVEKGAISRMNMRSELHFINPPPKRMYLHGDAVPLPLEWEGKATELLIQTLGQPERTIPVGAEAQKGMADLQFGQHRIYLRNGDRSSAPLDIQVWRAPVLHLLNPLPRNRIDMGTSVNFVWQRSPEVPHFSLKILGRTSSTSKSADDNTYTTRFESEEDLQWYVEGIDRDGFVIPPLYRYPLFIRSEPFAAPKLKTPQLRQPAAVKSTDKGAWLWNLFIAPAYADDTVAQLAKFEAVFSWEPVAKADQYVIEISETADFREPVVNKTIAETEFVWRPPYLQKYYWRVAAGSSKGRMGLFTEPVTVDFEPLKANANIAALDDVLIRRPKAETKSPKTLAEPVAPAVAATLPLNKTLSSDEAKPQFNRRINLNQTQDNWRPLILWQPNYSSMKANGTGNSAANLSGGTGMNFGLEVPWRDYRNALWLFDASVGSYSFRPDPREKYPFQGDLNWLEFDVSATRFTSYVGLGLKVRQLLSLRRTDYEVVTADTALWFGPQLTANYALPRGEFNVQLSGLFSRDGQAFGVQPEWRCHIGDRFVTGIGADALWMLSAPSTSLILRAFVTVGFPF